MAFKVLHRRWPALTFIDAFSGPWSSKAGNYSDTSFMIALETLAAVRQKLAERGRIVKIRCFFSERNGAAYRELEDAVAKFREREPEIEVLVRNAEFLDLIDEIVEFSKDSFKLSFIDPTGWTGFSLPKLAPLLSGRASEALVNFMYDFINRASGMADPKTRASLEPILGDKWWDKLPAGLPRGEACEQIFRANLQDAGGFRYVLSTKIDRVSADRPHFFLAYGTNSAAGIRAFRETERAALSNYGKIRAELKSRKHGDGKTASLFGDEALPVDNSFDKEIAEKLQRAQDFLVENLFAVRPNHKFDYLAEQLMMRFPIRETEIKDMCVRLSRNGILKDTWSDVGKHKPGPDTQVELARLRP
jgi:three-Cys-motif partner protein